MIKLVEKGKKVLSGGRGGGGSYKDILLLPCFIECIFTELSLYEYVISEKCHYMNMTFQRNVIS